MKVLWLCNVILSEVARDLNLAEPVSGGWLSGILNGLCEEEKIELTVCFPHNEKKKGRINRCGYCSFVPSDNAEKQLEEIVENLRPDIIHIFGTERLHAAQMIRICERKKLTKKTIVSIQGLVSVIAKHYNAFLPNRIINGFSFRDFVKKDNVRLAQRDFVKNGINEIAILQKTHNVIGRTDWDYACVKRINPNINYYYCNENLRPSFYDKKWEYTSCEKNSIFVSQCNYPIKGFHLVLEAFSDILSEYTDAKLYVAGKSPLCDSFKGRIRRSYYGKYLGKLIKAYGLEEKVHFLGVLSEQQMCERFLKSNVFVSASAIENSSNSVGEAMLLGVPTVSSFVGGIPSMLSHGKEGFLYQADAPYMLAYYVKKLFADTNLQQSFSENSRLRAQQTHNVRINTDTLMKIYEEMI